ncbi:MAG: tRNA 4-thiouridine(8) synthase ThiI [Syntrophobacteraceae bacterium]|nr:tRNA 4-thiouridine(8) synthase ThiI [Syntrophobacteraceae bacterium]
MAGRAKGVGLLSGGLDSILAVKVLQEQPIDLLGLTFVTPFFGPSEGLAAGAMAGIETRAIDISEVHLEMVKKPRYGYGSKLNPCIDCHGLMLREAAKIMEAEGADFLFTGEVLGQRPMSQRRDSLRSVEKLSGLSGRILRPLSAKRLSPTRVEKEGLVDRSMLLGIYGRSRKPQMELALKYGLRGYPQPGGGCMLTNEGFSNRLRNLLDINPGASVSEVEIIKWGRAFKLPGKTICMVGRNESENHRLEALAGARDIVLRASDHPGPTCVILAGSEPRDLETASSLLASYSAAPKGARVTVEFQEGGFERGGERPEISAPNPGRRNFSRGCFFRAARRYRS